MIKKLEYLIATITTIAALTIISVSSPYIIKYAKTEIPHKQKI